jgi:hypothetical protein
MVFRSTPVMGSLPVGVWEKDNRQPMGDRI